ncbi:hypothetical protein DFH07DRAFT_773024 [Mycena maculata]|uniref:Uncharacterized protein n=1 Tax=Mycena maculata TaxID=230809 RepID=A0AAD7J4W0_9AGAR|nr:hypothetical protein DFH07DRAFT_773024 [Mycena maculata]
MARKSKPLPPGVEEDKTTNKVRCLVCKEANPLNTGKWIEKKSLNGHLEGNVHLAHAENKRNNDLKAAERSQRLENTYSGAPADPIPSGSIPVPTPRAEMNDVQCSPGPGWHEYEAAGLNAPVIPPFITPSADDQALERERLREQVERLLTQSEESDEEDDMLNDTFKDFGFEATDDEESYFSSIPIDREYTPYPNKVMSSNQLKMILWILKECKVVNVPSYSGFRSMQDHLRNLCGSEPKGYTSSIGNRFFVNNVRELIARDFANPEIVKHLNFYPEEVSGPISEVWQAERWKEFEPSELTPMYSRSLHQFYIEEVAGLADGKMVIPLAWIKCTGVLCADYLEVSRVPTGWKIGQDVCCVPASEFRLNYDIVERIGDKITWAYDVSGNKSKQYNKHMNMYMANSNLPGQLLQQEYFVCFVSTSPHAGSLEQFLAIKEQIEATHTNPIACYNAETRRECHAGLPRFTAHTKQILEDQIKLATYGVEARILKLQTATGVKCKVAQYWINILLEKAQQMKADSPGRTMDSIAEELQTWLNEQPGDKVNPLLDIAGLDPNRDTPVELLHTILLGIIKNGLIGKHFKTLMQTMVFHMHGLVSPEVFRLVKAVSALGSVLWVHEINDMAEYTEQLTSLIGNVLDTFGDYDPAKLLLKIKLHLLPHIVEDVIRFGPAIRNSTEIFECFNAIFRLYSILSNHQAPSRDIASKFASMDCLKHILSGGF